MSTTEKQNLWYVSNFEALERSLNGEAASYVHALRKAAFDKLSQTGFPTTKDEEWKYTDVSSLAKTAFKPILSPKKPSLAIEPYLLGHPEWNRLVFVNGHFLMELSDLRSLPKSVIMGSLAEAMKSHPKLIEEYLTACSRYEQNAFTALNTAFIQDGAFVYVPKGTIIEQPLHLLFISSLEEGEFVSHPRNVIIVGESSQVAILESYVSPREHLSYFTNAVTEISVGENAVVEYDKFQNESMAAYHIASTYVRQQRNSNYASNLVTFGAKLSRNNVFAVLDGEGIECTLNGLYLGTANQHIDNHTTIDHAKPHCNSFEVYKGILDGKSKGVFNGKIIVRKDAQKTDAKQTNKNLVLSDEASIDTKPQLEIFANDVKCTHGATIGQLDREAIFYLQSRGLSKEDARDMLIHAFAKDLIDRIKSEGVRTNLEQLIYERLRAGRVNTRT
ncbi:MAG TPA: Fe-S cluster assembly protein SufD [Bacteroidota bacterium]|nr:Fe-S cluster assembly protein SufD [Bacteroidota bacterium]